MSQEIPDDEASFLLLQEFEWWWPHRCPRDKARDIVRHMTDRVTDENSEVTGVLYVGDCDMQEIGKLAIKLNSFGWPDDETYEERLQAAEDRRRSSN